jgi:hypothetical protein
MPSDTATDPEAIDFDGVILLPAMCRLLKTGDDAIRQRLKEGTFPVLPLRGVDHRLRWWGPAVKRWLDEQGGAAPAPAAKEAP